MRDERGALIFFRTALRPHTARTLRRAGATRGELRPKKYFLGGAFARWPSASFTVEKVRSFNLDTPLPARPRDHTAHEPRIHTLQGRARALGVLHVKVGGEELVGVLRVRLARVCASEAAGGGVVAEAGRLADLRAPRRW